MRDGVGGDVSVTFASFNRPAQAVMELFRILRYHAYQRLFTNVGDKRGFALARPFHFRERTE